MSEVACPCGSGLAAEACCRPRHDGRRPPETAEALMRARYVAFAEARGAFLRATHAAPSTDAEQASLEAWARSVTWLGLSVLEVEEGGVGAAEGWVRFVARYLEAGAVVSLEERSHFLRRDGRWLYVDGAPQVKTERVARNEPCPCQSGKKFKQCHGR